MDLLERINLLESDSIRNDFLACYLEMSDELEELSPDQQFNILAKVVEISYKSVITSHEKANIPKEVLKQAFNQGRYSKKEFIKRWQNGELDEIFNHLPSPNKKIEKSS